MKKKPRGNPSKAGKVTAAKLGKDGVQARATKGGNTLVIRYGTEYFRAIRKKFTQFRSGNPAYGLVRKTTS